MIWPFRRRKPRVRPPLQEKWKPGDLAYCISPVNHWQGAAGPSFRSTHRVTAVEPGHFSTGELGWGLGFDPWPLLYDARAFRKVEPCSEDFASRLAKIVKSKRKEKAPA